MDVNDIKSLYYEENYEEICSMWDKQKDSADLIPEYDFVYYINSLYKQKRYQDCLMLYKIYHHLYSKSDFLDDKMGWSLYHVYLKEHDFEHGDNRRYLQQVNFIFHNHTDSPYSPWNFIMLTAVKIILKKKMAFLSNQDTYHLANTYLDSVNPEHLSDIPKTFNAKGKSRQTASDRENWYSYKIRVLYQLKSYHDCVAYFDKALSHIHHFCNHGDVWIRRWQIESLMQLGELDKSEASLQIVLQGNFKHWFFYQLAFEVMMKKGDLDKALIYAGACALCDNSHDMRVKFYAQLVPIFYKEQNKRPAMLHRQLVNILRQENNWPPYKWNLDWDVSLDIKTMTKKDILQELTKFWQQLRDKDKVFLMGTVKKMLPSGQDGFVTSEAGQDYYFKVNDVEKGRKRLQEGCHVRFTTCLRVNRKKQRQEENAIEITVKD